MLEQALIIAAGWGKRMGKLTAKTPKCLLEVNGKPLLKYQLDALKDTQKIIISVNRDTGEAIAQYVKNTYPHLNCVFVYAEPKGVAYAVYSALEVINTNQNILITVADTICLAGYGVLIDRLQSINLALGITTQPPIADKIYTHAYIDRDGSLQLISKSYLQSGSSLIGVYALNNSELFCQCLRESIDSVTSGRLSLSSAIRRGIVSPNREFRLSHIFCHLSQHNHTIDLVNLGDCCEINYPRDLAIATQKLRSPVTTVN